MNNWIKHCLLSLTFFLFVDPLVAQQEVMDSLSLLLEQASNDTQKVNLLFQMAEADYSDTMELQYYQQVDKILSSLDTNTTIQRDFYWASKALVNSNMGSWYNLKGEYEKAIKFHHKANALFEKAGKESQTAKTLSSIGFTHLNLGQFEEALAFYNRALIIHQKLKDTSGMASALGEIAVTYSFLDQPSKQITMLRQALILARKSNNEGSESSILNNIAVYHYHSGNIDSAKIYMTQSLNISMKSKQENDIAFAYLGMSGFYRIIGEPDTALFYAQKANEIGIKIKSIDIEKRALLELYTIQLEDSNYREALTFYVKYREMRDSLLKEEGVEAALKTKFKYEKEKQEAITQAEKQKQNLIILMISVGLLLVLVFAVFMFNRYKITQKQKRIIEVQQKETEEQKQIVEEKNKEITDSITYAKRLQEAILPPDKLIKQHLPNSFVFFKPKDIVAGDFYWLEENPNENKVFIAAADCTGHGVPGAMVSVVCNNALHRSMNEFSLRKPADILGKTRELVIETFEKSDEDVKDGMDIALCSIDKKSFELQYSGANNPLWLYREGIKELTDLEEIKADKQPIGKYSAEKPFNNHSLELQKGDTFYIFSDGFADQFGGEKGKKFKYKPFKELLLSMQNKSMEEQLETLNNEFDNWKGSLEQIDDVCVIGVRV